MEVDTKAFRNARWEEAYQKYVADHAKPCPKCNANTEKIGESYLCITTANSLQSPTCYSRTCLVHTSKGTQNQYKIRVTCYQGWFMYMRYTQGQNEEYLLSRSVY